MATQLPRIGFIGAGTVATALAGGLLDRGYRVTAVASRTNASALKLAQEISGCKPFIEKQKVVDNVDLVFITTPDGAISAVTAGLKWQPGKSVVHCSGADTSSILGIAAQAGAATGVFHPLQTFAGAAGNPLAGITYSIEAQEPLLSTLKTMADALGGRWIVLRPEDKPLYHASAVIVCNYLVTLMKIASDLWQDFGIPREEAVRSLLPLMKASVNNLESKGIPACLTGPISRGDAGTVSKHLAALEGSHVDLIPVYRELALQTIPVALQKGKLEPSKAIEIENMLKENKR